MPLPRIAIVGKPNAGKSSLMNMIAGAKVSIVDPTPGVTRDRVSAVVTLDPPYKNVGPKAVEFIDTGGYGAYYGEGARFDEIGNDLRRLTREIETQIARAVSDADLILFAIDVHAGITPADEEIARMLREQRLGQRQRDDGTLVPVRVVATKVDGPSWEPHAHELSALGFGQPLMCSAKNNYMRRDFLDALHELTPDIPDARREPPADVKIAIIGKRNAGKSTLVNRLAGEERVIVSEIPGTTRDAIDVRIEVDGRAVVVVDTAGVRRKKSFQGQVEWYAFDRLQRALDRADVALLLIDATTKISQVDEQLAMLCQKSFKPVVIVVNKWDLAAGQPGRRGRPVTAEDYEQYLRRELGGLPFAPVSFMSGLTGLNARGTLQLAFELADQARAKVGTGRLNRVLRRVVELRSPPNKLGTHAKVFYVAQTGVMPPTITMIVSHPELFTPNYQRFLLNRIREITPFEEVPIRLNVRARSRTEQSERGMGPDLPEELDLAEAAELFADDLKAPGEPGSPARREVPSSGFALIDEDGREITAADLDNFTDEELDAQIEQMLDDDQEQSNEPINEPAGLPDSPVDEPVEDAVEDEPEDFNPDAVDEDDAAAEPASEVELEDSTADEDSDEFVDDIEEEEKPSPPRGHGVRRPASASTPPQRTGRSATRGGTSNVRKPGQKKNRPSKAKREARTRYFEQGDSGGSGSASRATRTGGRTTPASKPAAKSGTKSGTKPGSRSGSKPAASSGARSGNSTGKSNSKSGTHAGTTSGGPRSKPVKGGKAPSAGSSGKSSGKAVRRSGGQAGSKPSATPRRTPKQNRKS